MQANKENIESIHRIDPESTGEIAGRFEELVHLLESESDERVADRCLWGRDPDYPVFPNKRLNSTDFRD